MNHREPQCLYNAFLDLCKRLGNLYSTCAQVRLAKEAREQAVIALQKEPGSDLAHHLMGRWHWEMANLNGIVRALIRLMYGTDLAPGSHAEALNHYRRAAELNPSRLVHRYFHFSALQVYMNCLDCLRLCRSPDVTSAQHTTPSRLLQ